MRLWTWGCAQPLVQTHDTTRLLIKVRALTMSTALTWQAMLTRCFTTDKWPLWAARMRGVSFICCERSGAEHAWAEGDQDTINSKGNSSPMIS